MNTEAKAEAKAEQIARVLKEFGRYSVHDAAWNNDVPAVRAVLGAGAHAEERDEDGWTAAFAAGWAGAMAVLMYLAEECDADLLVADNAGTTSMHYAALNGRMEMVSYLSKKAPGCVDIPDHENFTPVMHASDRGNTDVVRLLARLGCSLSRKTISDGYTALDLARHYGRHDTARLLSDIDAAGGWRGYVAARRMAYVRIRHEVSKTYAVLDEDHKLRTLYHFVFGKNEVLLVGKNKVWKTAPSLTLPMDLFGRIIGYLQS